MDIQQELREDYEAGDDYHYELWYSEMKCMQRDGEQEMMIDNELHAEQPLNFEGDDHEAV